MTPYHERRIVSWVAYWCNKGYTLPQIVAQNAKRRPPFVEGDIVRLYRTACQAVRNAELIRTADPSMRICDIPGCKFPPVEKAEQPQRS